MVVVSIKYVWDKCLGHLVGWFIFAWRSASSVYIQDGNNFSSIWIQYIYRNGGAMTQPVQWLLTVIGKVPSTFRLLVDYGLTSSEKYFNYIQEGNKFSNIWILYKNESAMGQPEQRLLSVTGKVP
jgi:uncharacterized membrane protein YobD (UPF0266 family)